jgi:hypothetical protein
VKDDQSLERIHTFHLKKSPVKNEGEDEMTVVTLDPKTHKFEKEVNIAG